MADNLAQNGGGIIATDEITTLNREPVPPVHAQRVKVTFGFDGSLQDVTPNDQLPTRDELTAELLGLIQSSLALMSYNTNSALRVDLVNGITATLANGSALGSVGVSGAGNVSAVYDQYQQMMIGANAVRAQIITS